MRDDSLIDFDALFLRPYSHIAGFRVDPVTEVIYDFLNGHVSS